MNNQTLKAGVDRVEVLISVVNIFQSVSKLFRKEQRLTNLRALLEVMFYHHFILSSSSSRYHDVLQIELIETFFNKIVHTLYS